MIVAVYGAWYSERNRFVCSGSEDDFRIAGRQLGALLAELGHRLIVTSFSSHTLDGYVAEGYLEWTQRERKDTPVDHPPDPRTISDLRTKAKVFRVLVVT